MTSENPSPQTKELVTHIRPSVESDPICYAWQVCASGDDGAVPVYADQDGMRIARPSPQDHMTPVEEAKITHSGEGEYTPIYLTIRNSVVAIFAESFGEADPYKSVWMSRHQLEQIAAFCHTPSKPNVPDLEAQVAFTLSDASRLLRKQDIQAVCPHPDDCFYEGGPVRCGPCAVKASANKGVEINDRHSHLPEVCRLRREVKAAQARIAELEATTPPQNHMAARWAIGGADPWHVENWQASAYSSVGIVKDGEVKAIAVSVGETDEGDYIVAALNFYEAHLAALATTEGSDRG